MIITNGFIRCALLILLLLTARFVHGATDWPGREMGVVFFCPATSEQIVPQLEKIKRDGVNQIEFASWPWTVPERGTAIYSNAVTTLNWCENNGMDFWLMHNLQYHAASAEKSLTNGTGLDAEDETLRPWMKILSAEPAPAVTCEGAAAVETRVWRSGADVYLLAVNSASEAVTAQVSVAGGCKGVQAEFGQPPEVKDGKLVYTFAPLEPMMVRLSGVP